jgi:hypothetical protein
MFLNTAALIPDKEDNEYWDVWEEHRTDASNKRFNTFTSSIIPTEGMVIQDIDAGEFMTWLYNHRDRVWVMLYGSRDPQKAKNE